MVAIGHDVIAHGAMGGTIELFLVPASAPWYNQGHGMC